MNGPYDLISPMEKESCQPRGSSYCLPWEIMYVF